MKGPAPAREQTAHHQRDRALLRGGSPPYSAAGLLCERSKVWIASSAPLFQRSSLEWKTRTSPDLHKLLDVTLGAILLARTIPL
jgi:hypothetical protein